MKHKKVLMGFLLVAGIIIAGFWAVSSRNYPVASVNDELVSAKALQESADAAEFYFRKLRGVNTPFTNEEEKRFKLEVRRASLDSVIETILVSQKLKTIFEESAITAEVNRRVENTTTTEVTAQATQALFNLGLEDFRRLVLEPQARREILEEELKKEDKTYVQWVAEARTIANVDVFASDLVWGRGAPECASYCVEIKQGPGILDAIKQIIPSSTVPTATSSTSTPQ